MRIENLRAVRFTYLNITIEIVDHVFHEGEENQSRMIISLRILLGQY